MTYKLTTFDGLKIGQTASLTKAITEEDLNYFIAITGDENPLHVDKSFAKQTFFGQRCPWYVISIIIFNLGRDAYSRNWCNLQITNFGIFTSCFYR